MDNEDPNNTGDCRDVNEVWGYLVPIQTISCDYEERNHETPTQIVSEKQIEHSKLLKGLDMECAAS